jgi:hypothetical protein
MAGRATAALWRTQGETATMPETNCDIMAKTGMK